MEFVHSACKLVGWSTRLLVVPSTAIGICIVKLLSEWNFEHALYIETVKSAQGL